MSVMPLVKGLSVEGMNQHAPSVENVVCNAYWKKMQLKAGGPIEANNDIDHFIASGKPGVVRMFMGTHSPDWVLQLAGTYVEIDSNPGAPSVTATCPRWWTTQYQAAAADFISKLQAKYDGKISMIFIANNMTLYAEIFQRATGSDVTRANLVHAGYTAIEDQASYMATFNSFRGWKSTRLGMAVTPWQFVKPDGTAGTDVLFTNTMIDKFKAVFPSQAVLQNNSIRYPAVAGQYTALYDHMTKSGLPLQFQTATSARIGVLPGAYADTIRWAIGKGASRIELSDGFQTALTATQLVAFDKALRSV